MSQPDWIKKLEDQSGGKPVLVVEGNIDVSLLSRFLTQVSPGWETQFVMGSATRKSRVIEAIRDYHPEWAGIIDTDEWPPNQVPEALKDTPTVKPLPRFCLENYFCIPQEIWTALPENQRQTLDNDPSRLQEPILAKLSDWVAHGAMWRVIRKRRKGLLYESSFSAELDRSPVTDLSEIRNILTIWHDHLNPDQIIAKYQAELNDAIKLSSIEQLKSYIHGKKFFRQVVTPNLNQLFSPTTANDWLQRFGRNLVPPADLQEFLLNMVNLLT